MFSAYYDKKDNTIWPCTVVFDRYGGTYSKGKWTAWELHPEDVPEEISSDDITVHRFFLYASEKPIYGRGDTAQEAVDDLIRRHVGFIRNEDITE